jgi:hypothetical protein
MSHIEKKQAQMRAIRIFVFDDTKLKKESKVGSGSFESWGCFATESDVEREGSLLF